MTFTKLVLSALALPQATGHGQMVFPPNRMRGSYAEGGNCLDEFSCLWFSQPVEIPGEPILNEAKYRTYNVKVSSGAKDWTRRHPWRAPGRAPVLGRGCAVGGGNSTESVSTAGFAPKGIKQGFDGLDLPEGPVTEWRRGSVQEVAYGLLANHGGGYSWRLCPNNGDVSEACFQKNVLSFHNDTQFLRFADVWQPYGAGDAAKGDPHRAQYKIPDYEIPLVKWIDPDTGAEWARNPVPGCALCDQGECMKLSDPDEQQYCSQSCSGMNMTHCPPGLTQFPEPLSGISGFDPEGASGFQGFPWSIVDFVKVPATIWPGKYILSWRWDCEQSNQIWQSCADILIT